MKKILLVLFIFLFVCGCDNGKDVRIVNVLNWSSYIPNEVISDFSKETGIKVNYSTYSSNEELLAKISSSKEGTYDLIFPSDYMLEVMIRRDMLEMIDTSKLNNFDNLNAGIMIGAGGSIDVLAGRVKRAPKLFIKLHLEWFYRLLKEPTRFKRMLVLPQFIKEVKKLKK